MARDEITITLGELDDSKSVNIAEVATADKQAITAANGIKLKDAAGAKYESIWICVEASANGSVTVKAGNAYPNNLLGDKTFTAKAGLCFFQLPDYARFLNTDGSVDIDFSTGFSGNICAIGQRAGLITKES